MPLSPRGSSSLNLPSLCSSSLFSCSFFPLHCELASVFLLYFIPRHRMFLIVVLHFTAPSPLCSSLLSSSSM
jgi:hypothetical protein